MRAFSGFARGGQTDGKECRATVSARLLIVLASLAAVFALTAASASAQTGHKFLMGIPTSPFTSPEGVATDSSGDLFVATHSGSEALIDVYDPAGKLRTSFGLGEIEGEVIPSLAVDAAGRVYVASELESLVYVFKPAAGPFGAYSRVATWTGAKTFGGSFGPVVGVAVDNSTNKVTDPHAGDVYVLEESPGQVNIFPAPENETEEPKQLGGLVEHPELETGHSIAVNSSTGQVYVAGEALEKLQVQIFKGSGGFEHKILGTKTPTKDFISISGVGVDEATGNVYVVDPQARAVNEFSGAGEWLGWLTGTESGGEPRAFGEPLDVAVAPAGAAKGDVYVTDAEANATDVFEPDVTVPAVETGKPLKIEREAAILKGTINTEGKATTYYFETGEAEHAQSKQCAATAAPGLSTVECPITGLKAGHTYTYRLVAQTAESATEGAIVTFESAPAVTGLTTLGPTNITSTSATLNGSLKPGGIETQYRFEYGKAPQLNKQAPIPFEKTNVGGTVTAATTVTGLSPDTEYVYRIAAFNKFGTTFGAEERFFTSGPTIEPLGTELLSHTSAKVSAEINPNKVAKAKFKVEYGETTAYGASTEEHEIGEARVIEKEELKGLKLATTYHYRFVVVPETGPPFDGPDQSFTTPLIDDESAFAVGESTATLQAHIKTFANDAAKYHFEYGTSSVSETSSEEKELAAQGTAGDHAVEVPIAGLHPSTAYRYRIVVKVAEGTGTGAERSFTTTAAATFQLPDSRSYEKVTPADKGAAVVEALAEGGGVIQASTSGNALAYIVDGAFGEPESNRSFEAEQALAARGEHEWTSREIMPPTGAIGAGLGNRTQYAQFSPDLALSVLQPFPLGLTPMAEPPLSPPASEAERGHQEKTIYIRADAPLAPSGPIETALYEEAVSEGKIRDKELEEEKQRPFAEGVGYKALVTAANTNGTPFGGTPGSKPGTILLGSGLLFVSATPDLSHALFTSEQFIAPEGPVERSGLYESFAGKISLVSILPASEGGGPASGTVVLGTGEFPNTPTTLRHAQSEDGSRVVWTREGLGHGALLGEGDLYLRDTSKHQTVRLDVPETGLPQPVSGRAEFQTASANDEKVFFTDVQDLTANASANVTSNKKDLYVCQIGEAAGSPTCHLKDITPDTNGTESAGVEGTIMGASESGTAVYFVATGMLATGATPGAHNLYVANEGAGGTWAIKFIATLSSEDGPDWGITPKGEPNQRDLSARVSPNGQYLAFMSNRSLTGYDNTDVIEEPGELKHNSQGEPEFEAATRHADEEVFLYNNASSAPPICVSCNPSGARPRGVFDSRRSGEGQGLLVDRPLTWATEADSPPVFTVAHWLAGSIPGWTRVDNRETLYQSHYLTNKGQLFFMSPDALTRAAEGETRREKLSTTEPGSGKTVGLENVYEFEPSGVGSCASPNGCVSQVSEGKAGHESAFLDATETPSGEASNVFFLTTDKSVPQDTDTALDIYDARVCPNAGECLTQSGHETTQCESIQECHGEGPPPPPSNQVPATASFSGPGNSTHNVPSGEVQGHKEESKPKTLTNAQKLAAALAKCHKLKHKTHAQKHKRSQCEASARKKYGAKKASVKKASVHAHKAARRGR